MAEGLEVLFKIKAQNQASAPIHAVQADVQKLRQSFGSDFTVMQGVATTALSNITGSLTRVAGNLPVVGSAVNALSSSLGTMAGESVGVAGSLGAIAGPAGIALIAVGGLTAGILALHKGLFNLAEQAAEFRGKLFDTSQQLGISVETLSALEILVKTTGGSIEGISASLGIFQKHLEDAQDPTTKQAKLFDELGVATDNTEQALRDTLKALAAMPTGFKQTATALELFGRGGKSILAILKEMDGDLDGAIEKFRELGLIISREDAEAADKFNDQLAILQFQFRALLGKEVIPAALQSLQDLSKFLKENEQDIRTVSIAVGNLATVLSTTLNVALAETAGIIRAASAPYIALAEALERVDRVIKSLRGNIPAAGFSLLSPSGGAGGINDRAGGGELLESELLANAPRRGSRGADPAATARQLANVNLQIILDRLKAEEDAITRSLDLREILFSEYSKAIRLKEAERHQAVIDGLDAEEAAANRLRNGQQKEIALAEIRRKRQQEDITHAKEKQAVDDAFADRVQIITDFIDEQRKAIREITVPTSQWMAAVDDLVESLKNQGIVLDSVIETMLRLRAGALGAAESARQLFEAVKALEAVRIEAVLGGTSLTEDQIAALAGAVADAIAGLPPIIEQVITLDDALVRLGDTLGKVFGAGKEFGEQFGEVVGGALRELAFGIGSLIEDWVLLGNTGPQAMRKLVASVLAGVAAQAAVKSIYELASGFAALFLNPAQAAAHFTAAALFGSIAGATAIAGRAVAGNAFQQQPRGGGGGSSGNGSAGALQAIIQPRNQPAIVRHEHVLRIVTNDSHIVETVGKNWRDGGALRELILNDGT